jgi:hypothetical protein
MSLISYPAVKALFDRVLEHRRNCPYWNTNKPCFDCHYGMLTPIEKELKKKRICKDM